MKDRTKVYQKEIETLLEEVTAVLLKDTGAPQDFDLSFLELGINSVLAVELVETVNQRLDIHLGIEVIFDYRGIRELAQHIIDEYGTEICHRRDMAVKPGTSEKPEITGGTDTVGELLLAERDSDIAIIGISGRFAGSENIAEFWDHLLAGDCCIGEISRKGWEESSYFDPDPDRENRSVSRWGGFLTSIDKFDALFFNISPLEAERMDPQQRLFLEEAFKAFEDGGYSAEQLSGKRVGVFVGGRNSDYKEKTLLAEEVNSQTFLGNDMSILAARISYFLNIKGPSLAVDTACSSSLAAVHLACESIRRGESEIALAGGVFVLSSPEFYVMTSKTGMLSPDGKCKTFDNSANGIVVGEGVGALVVKRLGDALRDRDHIYGVIRGSAINQDGRTKGITAPSMLSQKALLCEVYQKAGVNPETISYIEAHGTGTKLGDPIEIKALSEAFHTFTDKTRFCAIGSHKPNFGHTIMTAGIGGVFKILMAMKHKTIPPTINIEKINEHIDFDNSPFYLNTEPATWETAAGVPRRAGVSSFGFSGTNCHVIIEEPPIYRNTAGNHDSLCYMFPFSARTETALTQKFADMARWLEREGDNYRLADISYTLFTGRSHFPMRCLLIAGSLDELKQKFQEIRKNGQAEGYYTEDYYTVEKKKHGTVEPMLAEYGGHIIAELALNDAPETEKYKEKLQVLAELYVKGYSLDWGDLYKNSRCRRVPLPAYPFAGQSYWIPETSAHENSEKDGTPAKIHPLLHENTSDFTEQRFTSVFTGQEFFLADHMVNRQRVLPGAAYLEMVRGAVIRAAAGHKGGTPDGGINGIRLRNVVWAQPIIVGDNPVTVHTGLFPEGEGRIDFEIYSQPEEPGTDPVIHCQGSALMGQGAAARPTEPVDFESLRAQCPVILTSDRCYDTFRAMGLDYGPGHRGLEEVYVGKGQVLARLALPVHVSGPENRFILHPSLMDAALQASIVLMTGLGDTMGLEGPDTVGPMLPFALQETEIFGKCVPRMWALVRYSPGSTAKDKVARIDIDICDGTGVLCVRLRGFSARIPEGGRNLPGVSARSGLMVFSPVWQEREIPVPGEALPEQTTAPAAPAAAADPVQEDSGTAYSQWLVILCESNDITRKTIETKMRGTRCLGLQSLQQGIEERFQAYTARVFDEIKAIFADKSEGKVLIQVVVTAWQEQQAFSGLSGLLKTARLENPKLVGQLIEVEPDEDLEGIISKLKQNSRTPDDIHIRYLNGKRLTAGWSELEISAENPAIPWKNRGTYLITGGLGGLGLILAREIALKAREAALVLTGRSSISADKQAQLREIEKLGARVEYRQVDVTKKEDVVRLVESLGLETGKLNGVIHCAGVLRDSFILKKTGAELQEVLAPKVHGMVNLDQATRHLELEFFIVFSSIAGSLGNPGQADYSAANAFMDNYARYRNTLVTSGQRCGHTLSINWPLWKEGGMSVDTETEKMLLRNLGMTPMETGTGILALYLSMASGKDQVVVMEGIPAQMKQKLMAASAEALPGVKAAGQPEQYPGSFPEVSEFSGTGSESGNLPERVRAALIQAVSKMLKVNREDLDGDTELSEYGFDSILFTQFTNKLNDQYGLELNPTIFFEYPTIHSFAVYLAWEHRVQLAGRLTPGQRVAGAAEEGFGAEAPESVDTVDVPAGKRRRSRFIKTAAPVEFKPELVSSEPVAVIGISGIFPMAGDLDEFWNNLAEGRDCITEIPRERWDWRKCFGDPDKEINKSNIKWGGFIDGVDEFDPLFFGISPKEAEVMDPQQRLLMTYVWKVIEDAGYSAQSLSGTNTGMFIGTVNSGYNGLLLQNRIAIEGYSATGSVPSVGPNRMSYFLNIHGPSEPIETACSSSLVAVHRAIRAIRDGSCEMAVAGGINTIITPELHISFSKAGMLCEDGRCKTFSDKANGYVRGEGVGMLFLKKLKAAEEAGDHIYGVIRGSAENHGGRANSLTSPNPKAQAELLINAYTRAGIDPRTVTYIEAHGTGTELGDPIEINGLKAAFGELYRTTGDTTVNLTGPYCGLGSVKTNIGHLELAAGIAGVIKVLLQLKHKTLAKSLHCDTINPYIKLEGSPFYLVRETQAWKSLNNAAGRVIPRRAGVSSFGFGGANAHVVIEEYIPTDRERPQLRVNPDNPAIVVLSAKNEERLQEQVGQLLTFLRKQQFTESGLADMAYTLQVGREPMEERLAVVAGSSVELEAKLEGFAAGREDITGLYRGRVGNNKETLILFAGDEDMTLTVKAWFKKRKYGKLLDLWVRGFHMDWNMLYGETKPRRISLPTYPFARERYWVPEVDPLAEYMAESLAVSGRIAAASAVTALIHPLVHRNTSDLLQQRFSSTFSGQEFFLADHVIGGLRILPAAACLEMTREAADRAAGPLKDGGGQLRLKEVIWLRPITMAEGPVNVHLGLYPGDNGEIAFDIYGEPGGNCSVPVLYSQGTAIMGPPGYRQVLDIEALLCGCDHEVSATRCYEEFRTMGINYGPAHQGVKRLYVGADRVVAELSLPISVPGFEERYILHPSLLDAAFQATIGLKMDAGHLIPAESPGVAEPPVSEPPVPYALQELEILDRCLPQMWALVRYSEDGLAGGFDNYDIDLCDPDGNVCVRIRGLAVRGLAVRALRGKAGLAKPQPHGTHVMFYHDWKELEAAAEIPEPEYQRHLVVLCEPGDITKESLEARLKGCRCLILDSGQKEIEERFETYAVRLLNLVRSLLRDKPGNRVLVQVVVSRQGDRQLFTGLAGILKTARLENPRLIGQLIEVAPGEAIQGLAAKLKENCFCLKDSRIRYEDGKRWVECWREIDLLNNETDNETDSETDIPWQDRGIYLISGGAGGLGLLLAREIAGRVREPALILTGRSSLSEDRQAKLKELEAMGAWIDYKQVDMTKKRAVASLIQRIREDYGNINGIIHCAGVFRDNFIINKTRSELLEVLGPKVRGLVNLDLATRDMPLDFLVLYSSAAGALGNPGQADYAAANAFMDSYARYRNGLVAENQRHGRTLAVNWPLWEEGGMGVDRETEQMILHDTGMAVLETAAGIRALYRSLGSARDQVMPLTGNSEQIRRFLDLDATVEYTRRNRVYQQTGAAKGQAVVSDSILREQTLNYVKQTLVNTIKIDPNRIRPETPFAKYGIDSIVQVNVIRELEKVTGGLPKTLLFEYGNIKELTDYLVKHHGDSFGETFRVENNQGAGGQNSEVSQPKTGEVVKKDYGLSPERRRFMGNQETDKPVIDRPVTDKPVIQQESQDIAIIGISGRYPMSDNLEELWEHMAAGYNCITEAPPNRWQNLLPQALSGESRQFDKGYYGGFLSNINLFDHHLFEIPENLVWELSPELRLFLEIIWETFENAGYTKDSLQALQTQSQKGIGVFVGTMYNQYSRSLSDPEQAALSSNRSDWEIANRTSHFFNLTGPSMAVNSACSSSMTAIHLACESLKLNSCSMAVAGGVNLTLDPSKYDSLQQTGFLGSGSLSRSFGSGDGYIPGEGVGAVLLKPLSLAVKDNDRIYGVIKGSFVNHSGGRQKYTAPDPKQQARLIADSLQRCGIDPGTISYVECAANGSELGDPIEVIALNNAFKRYTDKQQYCALGSVKSNVGHLEAASGICQLSKVLLQLRHNTLVPTINTNPRNPNVRLEGTAFYLQEETGPWNRLTDSRSGSNLPRRCMINSFGAGGSYANLIIEEYTGDTPVKAPKVSTPQEHLFVFSAKTQRSLLRYLKKMQHFLKSDIFNAEAIAWSLQRINHALEYRTAVVASSVEELLKKLKNITGGGEITADADIYTSVTKTGPDTVAVNQAIIQQALEEVNLRLLAQYWAAGEDIDLLELYRGPELSFVPLPGYAFDYGSGDEFNDESDNEHNGEFDDESDDKFYLRIFERVSKGELSEKQFNDLILT